MRILFLRSGNSTFYHDRAKELGHVAHTFAPILKRRLPVGQLEEALKDFENYDGLIMTSVETGTLANKKLLSIVNHYIHILRRFVFKCDNPTPFISRLIKL